VTDLPAPVERYLARALPPATEIPSRVRVGQEGEMRLKPGGRWLRFTAVEEFSVREIAFSWRARFSLASLVPLRVVDGYADGAGRLDARLFGLVPVVRARGPAVSEGEVYRYLAELPWAPHAILANRSLSWSDLDARTVEVVTRVGSASPAVRLAFDEADDVVRSWAERRPRAERRTVRQYPWRGAFHDHATLAGIRVPTRAEVTWELPDGPFSYWRGTITSLELYE
jgi:hypothetical protein